MAAYEGNVDRYARLRRPEMVGSEDQCVVRGAYHVTTFAKYLSVDPKYSQEGKARIYCPIAMAINARFIMNNDLSRIAEPWQAVPYLIHYPSWAAEATYEKLAEIKPVMRPQIARAAIVMDYQAFYTSLNIEPDYYLLIEARLSTNPFYAQDLLRRAAELNINIEEPSDSLDSWKDLSAMEIDSVIPRTYFIKDRLRNCAIVDDSICGHVYNGVRSDVSEIETFICCPPFMRPMYTKTDEIAEFYKTASPPDWKNDISVTKPHWRYEYY